MSNDSSNLDLSIELPNAMVERIERLNREFLQLTKEICELDPCAPTTLGIQSDLVEIIQQIKMGSLCKIARCGYLLPTLSIRDNAFWTRVAEGKSTEADLLKQFVTRD